MIDFLHGLAVGGLVCVVFLAFAAALLGLFWLLTHAALYIGLAMVLLALFGVLWFVGEWALERIGRRMT
jgi:hypothetical protein